MQKLNFPKTIVGLTIFIAFMLIAGVFTCGYLEIKKAKNNETDRIISTIIAEIQKTKIAQIKMTAENFCNPVKTKQIIENPSNTIIFKDKEKDGWLRVKNEKYGFEFSYPEDFILEEKEGFGGSYSPFDDDYYFAYVLTNPDFGKRIYECITEGEIEEYGNAGAVVEKYGITPTLNINVYKSQGDDNDFETPFKKNVLAEMDLLGISRSATLATLDFICGRDSGCKGEFVMREGIANNRDGCSGIILDKIDCRYVIKEYGITMGVTRSEQAIFLEKDNRVIVMYDEASEFSEYFEEILSTFRFFDEIWREDE